MKHLFFTCLAGVLFNATLALAAGGASPNILLIALDDMGHDTPVSFGGRVEGLTPHIDSLAERGMSFTRAFNTSSRCAPSRGSIMTGHYQDNYNEQPGTHDTTVRPSVRTVPEYLRDKGYLSGLFGKDTHYRPLDKYGFDRVVPMAAMAVGRSPELYAENIAAFIDEALDAGRPFFISANTHDPHRPFAGAPGEQQSLERRFRQELRHLDEQPEFIRPPTVEAWSGQGHPAPGFVPDHELVREEFGYYLNSSHRADRFVGALVRVLEDKGVLDDTLVIFHSDNGMHWPFAKSNVYLASVKTPLVVFWPGRSQAGTSSNSLVSTIDFLPTILEAVGIEAPEDLPGKSLLPLLDDPDRPQHERVFATINGRSNTMFEMRSVIGPEYIYIYNFWADGKQQFYEGKYSGGLALKGMEALAKDDPAARERLAFFYMRTREELYDLEGDPHALVNLAGGAASAQVLGEMRQAMLEILSAANDPFLGDFRAFLAKAGQGGSTVPVLAMDFESAPPGSPAESLLHHERLSLAPGAGVGGSTGLRA
ncbi:MAG: sulfatase-like hydrolase/transferase, partial [Xanthomonadales bacterium]|nr:sulfatase [Xanthomonadales bacterium]NIX12299.1 sulfatase-like hydrolase/transferase [Xanthomonadales bacterium]